MNALYAVRVENYLCTLYYDETKRFACTKTIKEMQLLLPDYFCKVNRNLLLNVLKYKPFLIKPNNYELGEMFGVTIKNDREIEPYARKLQQMGAVNVLVSMAGDGAMLFDEFGNIHRLGVCKGTVKNSVGAGDSMVAGFVAGLQQGDYAYALRMGTAAGGATAFSEGLAKKEEIYALMNTL